MTDIETMKAMLARANIQFEQERAHSTISDVPENGTSLVCGGTSGEFGHGSQPHDGGFGGFFAELVFDKDGALWAVWAWE